jgi:cytidylate kinase
MQRPTTLRGIDQLVSRQVSQWLQEQHSKTPPGETPIRPGPYVTISRQIGSGGEQLGRRLAERLGWQYYDRGLLEEMAKRAHTSSEVLAELESGPHGALHDAIVMALDKDYPGHHGYVKAMIATVTRLGAQGKAVILGRGAHYLLPSDWGIRVRLIAPLAYRVRRICERRSLTRSEAESWIEQAEENQLALIRNTLHRNLEDPTAYDVVLNMADLTPEAAEAVVLAGLDAKTHHTRA